MASKLHLKRNQFYELNSSTELNKIVEKVQGKVFEIGAGNGALTKLLKNPTVSEIDNFHYPKLSKYTNKLYGDFTKIPISELQNYDTFVGNLAYRQFKPIFEKLYKIPAKRMILLVQEQVGLKLIDEKLSRIKLLLENSYFIQSLGIVSKYRFKPVPSVNGIILVFKLKDTPVYNTIYLKEVVKIFSYNRKTLGKIYKLLNWNFALYTNKRPNELTNVQFNNILQQYIINLSK